MQQELRLFFPLFQARQIVGGNTTPYRQEINKLRNFGIDIFTPHLRRSKLRNYPYKIIFIFYTSSEIDMISITATALFMIHLLESNATLQSSDYRILPQIEIKAEKISGFDNEGCKIIIESIKE